MATAKITTPKYRPLTASCVEPEMKSPRVHPPARRAPKRMRKPPMKEARYRAPGVRPKRRSQISGTSRIGTRHVLPPRKPPAAMPRTKAMSHDPGPGIIR